MAASLSSSIDGSPDSRGGDSTDSQGGDSFRDRVSIQVLIFYLIHLIAISSVSNAYMGTSYSPAAQEGSKQPISLIEI